MASRTITECFKTVKNLTLLNETFQNSHFGGVSSTYVQRRNVASSTPPGPPADGRRFAGLLLGTAVAQDIRNSMKKEIDEIRAMDPKFRPGLAIVQVGYREDSNVYIQMKTKNAQEVGIVARHVQLARTTTEKQLIAQLEKFNDDESVHGVILQLPPDCDNKIDAHLATNVILASKDVDGLTDVNAGKLSRGDMDCIVPCTPLGCLDLIKRTGITLQGSKAVVLGRSKIVGSPMADLLSCNDVTVTKCHSKTRNLDEECRQADILVAAVGRAEMVKGDWIKPGAVVIDCGINAIPDPTKKSGQRLVGDVDFRQAVERAAFLTPVPGGVGPMTVALLLKNTLENAKRLTTPTLL